MAKSVFAAPQLVLAVDTTQARQFHQLGTPADCITVLGSLKLGNLLKIDKVFANSLKPLSLVGKILLAASTMKGEDAYVIQRSQRPW